MTAAYRLGMLTPSSNTVLEPVTAAILRDLPDVSAHFGRFRVTEISLRDQALGQFDTAPMLAAADLLADARVGSICWNGTSAGWLGFDRDRELCRQITVRTGIPATSAVLAFERLLRTTGAGTFGLVTPYVAEVQDRIVANFAAEGFACVAERHLDETVNYAFAEVSQSRLRTMIGEVAQARPDAIVVLCTNLEAAPLVGAMEAELGIPIHDSVCASVWSGLLAVGADPARVRGWGRLFRIGSEERQEA